MSKTAAEPLVRISKREGATFVQKVLVRAIAILLALVVDAFFIFFVTGLTEQIKAKRTARMDLLNGADLPLTGLGVEDGSLTYNGKHWQDMSGSDQLRVATAIVRRLNPDCGFVLLDKLEQMDLATLAEFGSWLQAEGLQAIATRVSTGGECQIIIEDGRVKDAEEPPAPKAWTKGAF